MTKNNHIFRSSASLKPESDVRTRIRMPELDNGGVFTWEELADDAEDLAAALVPAFNLEDLELLDQLFLLGPRQDHAHPRFLCFDLSSLSFVK